MSTSSLPVLAAAWLCVSLACTPDAAAQVLSGPRLVLSEADHDLDRINPKVLPGPFEITIRNTGDQSLEISTLRTSCSCLSASLSARKVAPGAEAKVRLTVLNVSFEESFAEEVLLYSNDPTQPLSRIRVSGTVGTAIRVLPTAAIGVGVISRTEVARTAFPGVRLVPGTGGPLGALRLTASHAWIKPEAIKQPDGFYAVTVAIDPAIPLGRLDGWVKVEAENPDQRSVEIAVVGVIVGDFDSYARRADFGFVKEGQPASVTFRLKNRGPRDIRLTSAEARLQIPADLQVVPEEGKTLRLVLRIASPPAFTPLTGEIELRTDGPDDPVIKIPVAGGVLSRHPFEQAAADGNDARFLALVKDALSRGERIPADKFISEVLGGVKDARSAQLLLRALEDASLNVRMRAADLLGEFDTPEVRERLRTAITADPEEFVRLNAIASYARLAGKSAVPTLLLSLQDDVAWVREESANYLAKVGDKTVIPALRAAMQDPDPEAAGAIRAALSALQAANKQPGNGVEKQ